MAAYIPLHLWRRMTDRRDGLAPLGSLPIVVGSPGGVDFGDMKEPHILDPAHMDAIEWRPPESPAAPAVPPMLAEAEVETGATTTAARTCARSPLAPARKRGSARSKWDEQPSQSSAVLIATVGDSDSAWR